MSNHYYANGAVINDQHKELNIHGNLTTQQMMQIAKDFFAEETEVTVAIFRCLPRRASGALRLSWHSPAMPKPISSPASPPSDWE